MKKNITAFKITLEINPFPLHIQYKWTKDDDGDGDDQV